jgi:hypothetical protein
VVITTSINDLTYRTSSKKRRALLPAIAAITCSPTLNTNILLHAFSEGGSSTSVHFAKAFLAQTRRRLPLTALIYTTPILPTQPAAPSPTTQPRKCSPP